MLSLSWNLDFSGGDRQKSRKIKYYKICECYEGNQSRLRGSSRRDLPELVRSEKA